MTTALAEPADSAVDDSLEMRRMLCESAADFVSRADLAKAVRDWRGDVWQYDAEDGLWFRYGYRGHFRSVLPAFGPLRVIDVPGEGDVETPVPTLRRDALMTRSSAAPS